MGIYPMLKDETCWFLAVDFDKREWQQDSAAFLATCRELDVPAALERSRWHRGKTAALLQLNYKTLQRKMKALGIE